LKCKIFNLSVIGILLSVLTIFSPPKFSLFSWLLNSNNPTHPLYVMVNFFIFVFCNMCCLSIVTMFWPVLSLRNIHMIVYHTWTMLLNITWPCFVFVFKINLMLWNFAYYEKHSLVFMETQYFTYWLANELLGLTSDARLILSKRTPGFRKNTCAEIGAILHNFISFKNSLPKEVVEACLVMAQVHRRQRNDLLMP